MVENSKRQPKDAIRALLIEKATLLVEQEGIDGLKARPIAETSGVSVGTIYNMFDGMDSLIMAINATTFEQLRAVGVKAAKPLDHETEPLISVTIRLLKIADAYMQFVRENENRWSAVLSFNRRHATPLPNWYRARMFGLFGIIEGVLKDIPAFADNKRERSLVARALFSSVNGIVGSAVGMTITDPVVANIRAQNKIVVCAVVAQYGDAQMSDLQARLYGVPH